MARPYYVAKKVGGRYELVRQDPSAKVVRTLVALVGAAIAGLGVRQRGALRVSLLAVGGAVAQFGITGRPPLQRAMRALGRSLKRFGSSPMPSD